MMAAGEVSYLRRFAGKFVEVVAAAIGTAVGGYLIAYVTGHFSFSMLPGFAPKPQQTVSAPAPTPDKASIEATVRAALANHQVSEATPPVATSPGTPQPTTPAAPVLPATASPSTIAVAPPLAPAEIKTLPVAAAADPPQVVDVGAGTGILTAGLIGLGADVTAVEPDPAMLAELRRRLPAAHATAGSAEALPVPDASVGAVLAGQAMHWFDMPRAIPEIARVLVPGGVFAGLWNVDDDRVGWVAELTEMSRRKASNTLLRWRGGNANPRPEVLEQAGAGLFGPVETAEFPNGHVYTADSLVATIATHSHLLVMDEPDRAALLGQVAAFLHAKPETSAGEFTLPMLTIVLRIRKLPIPPA